MAETRSKEYNQKVLELLAVIAAHKMRLIKKYGPTVAEEWGD